jgi:hypothetical protein
LGLSEPFRAKLGWLVGQLFSRVGTQDWERQKLKELIKDALADAAIWIEDGKISDLERLAKRWTMDNPGQVISESVIRNLVSQVPKRKEQVIEKLLEIIQSSQGYCAEDGSLKLSKGELDKLLRTVRNDPTISSLLK